MTWKMIDPSNTNDYPTEKIVGWSALQTINACSIFDYDNDLYIVYYNDSIPFEHRKYAVYTKHDGQLHCLLCHAETALNLTLDDPVNEEAFNVYHNAAIKAGFPEHIKHYWTWREVRDYLNKLDDRVLDMTAWVWCHGESLDGEIGITGMDTYYTDGDPNAASEDNHLSISIDD